MNKKPKQDYLMMILLTAMCLITVLVFSLESPLM